MPVQRHMHRSTMANMLVHSPLSQAMGARPRAARIWFIMAPLSSENIMRKMMPATTTEHSTGI